MTLFLFVVMMLNIRVEPSKQLFVRYLPLAILASLAVLALMLWVSAPEHFGVAEYAKPFQAGAHYSNTKELGSVLYTTGLKMIIPLIRLNNRIHRTRFFAKTTINTFKQIDLIKGCST